jgi:hypothetical protein
MNTSGIRSLVADKKKKGKKMRKRKGIPKGCSGNYRLFHTASYLIVKHTPKFFELSNKRTETKEKNREQRGSVVKDQYSTLLLVIAQIKGTPTSSPATPSVPPTPSWRWAAEATPRAPC